MEQELSRIDYIRSLIEDCRYDDALELLQIATDEEPDNIDYNYELARIFMELGNYSSAISNLELVVEKVRNHLLYCMLGEAYQADDQIDKAIGAYLKATMLNEKFPELNEFNIEKDGEIPNVYKISPPLNIKIDCLLSQDKPSCFPAFILNPPEHSVCIDCCAAPGSKTSQLVENEETTIKNCFYFIFFFII